MQKREIGQAEYDLISGIVNDIELSSKSKLRDNQIEVLSYSDSKKIVIRDENEHIDLRFWVRFVNSDTFYPSKKGIWVEKSYFKENVLKALNELFE